MPGQLGQGDKGPAGPAGWTELRRPRGFGHRRRRRAVLDRRLSHRRQRRRQARRGAQDLLVQPARLIGTHTTILPLLRFNDCSL